MNNLEQHQREMRERNSVERRGKQAVAASTPAGQLEEPSEVRALKKQVAELKKRVLTLEAENQRLQKQKTVVVERAPQQSSGDAVREQRHNFFKYSNARRY
jgi:molecular chaperone GrpE (heat shock protein)